MAATGYTRQSSSQVQNGQPISGPPLAAEFDALAAAFDIGSGHDHSGSVPGDGQKIPLTTAVVGILPIANGGTGAVNTGGPAILVFGAGTPTYTFPTTSKTLLANDFSNVNNSSTLATAGIHALTGMQSDNGLIVAAGAVTIASTLTVGSTLAVSSGITGSSTINGLGGIFDNGNRVISKSNSFVKHLALVAGTSIAVASGQKMAGLNQVITPLTTGAIFALISGNISNDTVSSSTTVSMRYGTGTAPAHLDLLTGTAISNPVVITEDAVTPGTSYPFTVISMFNATVGVPYWVDLDMVAIGAGSTGSITNLTICFTEI